jgi:hypothetical protein
MMSGDFLTASPPGKKTTARQEQARQSSTGDRAGNNCGLSINEVIHNDYIRTELAKRHLLS